MNRFSGILKFFLQFSGFTIPANQFNGAVNQDLSPFFFIIGFDSLICRFGHD